MPKVILLSYYPLPFSGVGSWTTMYNYYLNTNHQVDYLVCPEPDKKSPNVEYSVAKDMTFDNRLKRKFLKDRYASYIGALKTIIEPGTKYIIQVIENFGIVSSLNSLLEESFDRSNFYIQFFYHGFAPYYGNPNGKVFFRQIDEFVLLTNEAYKVHLDYYSEAACRFSVLHNAIDRNQFKPLTQEEKQTQKAEFDVDGKTVFLWCSQARPKKGLDLILDVWKRVYKTNKNIVLWVVGDKRETEIGGVTFFGKVPNSEVSKYYQMASIYLFPSLCQEGFGLSLIEALLCGNYCIASSNGGIPEVLNFGEYGYLIERPNFVDDWVKAINHALKDSLYKKELERIQIPDNKYDLDTWCKEMNEKAENAKMSLED